MLREQLDIPDMVVLVLPALVAVVQHADANEYRKIVQPELHRILIMARPVQVQAIYSHVCGTGRVSCTWNAVWLIIKIHDTREIGCIHEISGLNVEIKVEIGCPYEMLNTEMQFAFSFNSDFGISVVNFDV